MQTEPTVLAYLAGMIDGDGYITITKSVRKNKEYFGPQIGIAGTRREPHDLAASLWGGRVSKYLPTNPNHRPQFQWQRMGSSAVSVIESILPYLRIKHEHAELALSLHQHLLEAHSEDPFPWFGPNYDPLDAMRRMREEMIDMNQSRNRRRKKPSGRILDGVEHNGFPTL